MAEFVIPIRVKATSDAIDAVNELAFEQVRKEVLDPEARKFLAIRALSRSTKAFLVAASALDRLADLEQRVAAVESAGIKYCGVWQRAQEYGRGMVTTHGGSSWVAVADTTRAEPGDGPAWQLMARAGKDAR